MSIKSANSGVVIIIQMAGAEKKKRLLLYARQVERDWRIMDIGAELIRVMVKDRLNYIQRSTLRVGNGIPYSSRCKIDKQVIQTRSFKIKVDHQSSVSPAREQEPHMGDRH